jgi:hypothetical protein
MATDLGRLVDADNGLISRRIFIEPEIYAQELERIFARCWLFLCHESQIFAERNIPVRIAPNAGEPIDAEVPLGLVLLCKPVSFGRADPRPSLVLLAATPHLEAAPRLEQRQPPLGFSMSGLAG